MDEQLPLEVDENQNSTLVIFPEKPKKKGLAAKLRSLLRFRIRLQLVNVDAPEQEPAADTAAEEGQPDEKAQKPKVKEKSKKNKKEKKPKAEKKQKEAKQKEKKAKPPKSQKTKKASPKTGKKQDKERAPGKKRGLIAAVVALALVGAGTGTAIAISGSSPEARLQKAAGYMEKEQYTKAAEIYNALIKEEYLLPEAYLGLANTCLAAQDTTGAVTKLRTGLEATGDQRIEEKLAELAPLAEAQGEGALDQPLSAESAIVWKDPAMEQMVRQALGVPAPQAILVKDVEKIRSLKILGETHAVMGDTLSAYNTITGYSVDGVEYTVRGGIVTLDDLAQFKGLKRLTVGFNQVRDIGGISGLQSLEMLGLYGNDLEDISALASLSNLKYLYLYNNRIRDVTPLGQLSGLQELWLQYNDIGDISPLEGMPQLSELLISHNRLENIGAITSMPNLRMFYADYNRIADISAVAGTENLTDISFAGCQVSDYSPAAQVPNINQPYGRTSAFY